MPTAVQEPVSSPTATRAADLIVAGGLLEAAGELRDGLTVKVATGRLRDLLSPASLWISAPLSSTQLAESPRDRLGRVPRWRAADSPLLDRLSDTVLAAWDAALVPPPASWGTPVLRVLVSDAEAAQLLAGIGSVGSYLIVPCIAGRRALEFSWRWPMRIGIAQGPRSSLWCSNLESSPYAALYDVRVLGPGDEDPVDLLFVDADAAPVRHVATGVVVLGSSATLLERLAWGGEHYQSTIVIGAASADVDWFECAIREMAHDQPIDVALRVASPTALIAADADMLQLTAVRQWALALAEQLREQSAGEVVLRGAAPEERLRRAGMQSAFASEDSGATGVTKLVRSLDGQGYETALQIRIAVAMTPAGHVPQAAPTLGVVPARRLIADAWVGKRVRRKTLLPETDHDLLVRIAVPGKDETSAQIDFPEHKLPSGTSVELMVDVTSAALGLQARQPIVLSTADRSVASTTALFAFRTLGEGTVVDIKILVTYQERPLQEAHYFVTVRSRSVAGDRARLTAVSLSSSPEPRADATPAEVSLEVNGANLDRTGSRRSVDISQQQVRDILDTIEGVASRVLASDDAPEKLADQTAEELLVSLARAGASLRKYLAPLQIGGAATVSLLVDVSTPMLPLELVYDAPTPEIGAKLCEHRSGGKMVGKAEVCQEVGNRVVCPYAFWGQQRVIARTIRLDSESSADRESAPLSLRPVLYAAASRADAEVTTGEKPSDVLEAELASIVGSSAVVRVRRWNDWKSKVRKTHPQLLVVLGHTESAAGETLLEIGTKSWLRDPDIDAEYLRARDSPPPLVLLLACSSAVPRNCFGGLPAAFTGGGAAAVVATLTKLHGPHGARAAAAVVRALCGGGSPGPARLGAALTKARHQLIEDGLLVGLLLVSHGEIDLPLNG
jgi:hypothetical protein